MTTADVTSLHQKLVELQEHLGSQDNLTKELSGKIDALAGRIQQVEIHNEVKKALEKEREELSERDERMGQTRKQDFWMKAGVIVALIGAAAGLLVAIH